jgi:hypothetical protein
VVAQASVTHGSAVGQTSLKSYEGVFRTVIAMNLRALRQDGTNGFDSQASPLFVNGSNVKNGAPTIAGFPLRDQAANFDARYTKAFYRTTSTSDLVASDDQVDARNSNNRYLWVSSEIVSSWYLQTIGGVNGRGQQYQGDAREAMTIGYGDLSYAYNVYGSSINGYADQ